MKLEPPARRGRNPQPHPDLDVVVTMSGVLLTEDLRDPAHAAAETTIATNLLKEQPTPREIVVKAALSLRWAERDGTYADLLERRSAPLKNLPGR